jgi:hypothetical protein
MGRILGSKVVDSRFALAGGIAKWLSDFDGLVKITVEAADKASRKTIKERYEELDRGVCAFGDYYFDFKEKRFEWKGKDIHITDGEALFLIKQLVYEDTDLNTYYLRNMRKRLGKNFLKEAL